VRIVGGDHRRLCAMSWSILLGMDGKHHVVPDEDMRKHRITIACWCRPKLDAQSADVVVHNAMDERERYEDKPQHHGGIGRADRPAN
jgi:hypothetical protein